MTATTSPLDDKKVAKLAGKALEHLEPGENVLQAVTGSYETKRMGQDTTRKGVFLATDRRLVFYAKKLTGYDLEVFPYSNISSIEIGKNFMGHYISFFASGNKAQMKWINGGDVAALVSYVKSRIGGGHATSAAPAPVLTPSIPDSLRELAQLRDEGILSDADYEQKKAELMSRL